MVEQLRITHKHENGMATTKLKALHSSTARNLTIYELSSLGLLKCKKIEAFLFGPGPVELN